MIQADGSGLRRIASGHADGWYPIWTPDGRRLAVSGQEGAFFLDPDATDAPGPAVRIDTPGAENSFWPSSFSPDGRRLLGGLWNAGGAVGVALRSFDDGSQRTIRPGRGIALAHFLPDGRRAIVNLGDRLVVQDLTTGSSRDLVAVPAGHGIAWFALSRDGRWIAWLDTADESDVWMATLEGGR